MNSFYVYVYLDPRKPGEYKYAEFIFDFEPFYVGKGTKNRCYSGIRDKKKSLKVSKISSILRSGNFPIIIKIYDNLNNLESFNKELYAIEKIGRIDMGKGPLCNMTDGGTGGLGLKHKEEWKKILSKPVIQLKDGIVISEYISVKSASEITGVIKQNISSALTGRYKTAGGFEWKYKNDSDKLQGHLKNNFKMPNHTEKTRIKMSLSAKRGEDHHMKKKIGKDNPRSRKIIQKELDGKIIKIWDSLQDIKRNLGFSPSNICRCCKGEVKRIGGFLWDYYN
jgi:hypothetical protein